MAAWIAAFFHLNGISWLLNYVLAAGAVLIVILFQPELRRALAQIGRGRLDLLISKNTYAQDIVDSIIKAILSMSKKRTGALIVFERKTGLKDVLESGTKIGAFRFQRTS